MIESIIKYADTRAMTPLLHSPWDVLFVSDKEKAPIITSPVPTKSSAKAANTVLQFSLTFGCRQQVVWLLVELPPEVVVE